MLFGIHLGNVACYAMWRTGAFGSPLELNSVKTLDEEIKAFWDHSRLGAPVYCSVSPYEEI